MLNDLMALEKGLSAHEISVVDRHPDIKHMAKGGVLRVRLGANGRIASLEFVAKAGRGAFWTLRDAQYNGFPGLKTGFGLLHLRDQMRNAHAVAWENDKTPTGRRGELLHLLDNNSVDANQLTMWPNAGHRKRIWERLQCLCSLADDPLTASVPAAFQRFLAALDASSSFLEDLLAVLAKRVRASGDEWLDPARAALIGPIALAIDVVEGEFDRDACDLRQVEPVSAALIASPYPVDSQAEPEGLCALSGKTAKLHFGSFPQPNLPGLGQTYIFCRNRGIPSLTRYGRTADASFPVGSSLVRRLAGVIATLTQEDAKGRTWRLIPAEAGDKPDLLVVSMAEPRGRPADAVSDDDELNGEAALRELASRVIDQSRSIYEHDHPQSEVIVLILRILDQANRKTVYHRKTTAAEIWEAARRWQAATSNTPDWLAFPSPGKGKSEVVVRGPSYVAPLSITRISRVQFANGGRRRISVVGTTATAAFGLFLHDGDVDRSTRSLLRLLLQRQEAFLGGLAAARAKGIEYLKDFDPNADLRWDALRSVTWIGVLLHHLGHYSARKSEMSDRVPYTEGLAFRLGQFLAAADVIHVGYCADLRGGNVPPSLLGNSVLAIAGSNPTKALSILQSRLKPYLGWAKRVDSIYAKAANEEHLGNKGRAVALRRGVSQARRSEEIANDVHAMLAPYKSKNKKPDDVFKAELLLGYVAGLPPVTRKTGDPPRGGDNEPIGNEGE